MTNIELAKAIRELAKQKNAVIMAHYYQRPEVQEVADFIGDSLALAQKAAKTVRCTFYGRDSQDPLP